MNIKTIFNGSRKDQKMLSIVDCLMMENKSLKIELESCHQKVAKSYRVNIYLLLFNCSRVCTCFDDQMSLNLSMGSQNFYLCFKGIFNIQVIELFY